MASEIDPSVCPLCGAPNECGMAAGDSTCWCFTASFAPGALERIPEAARNVACICPKCASGKRSPQETQRSIDQLLRDR